MRLMRPEDKLSSPCSKSDLIKAIWEDPNYRAIDLKDLERSTRTQLITLASELGIILNLEERVSIMKILDTVGVEYSVKYETYDLVRLAIDHALAVYGVADIEALSRNRKKSDFSRGVDPLLLETIKANYREKCQMG
jgi:hypothetical protein